MQPLHDRTGQVYAWLDIKREHILDLDGRPIAFIVGDSVYDWSGRHIGWWQDGHMRDNVGSVVVFRRDATNLIVGRPGLGGIPGEPGKAGVPGRPGLAGKPGRPGNVGAWSRDMPF